jgi:hypothetical protein
MGLLGSPVPGFAFDAAGRFVLPGLAMPQPALGQRWTLQGAYLDPTNPTGVRLTFARHGFDL